MNKITTLLGFAAKAGELVTGSAGVEALIKKKKVFLVICATDLSPKTQKRFAHWCELQQIPFYMYGERAKLGQWIGRPEHGIVGVISKQFSAAIKDCLSDGGD